MVCNVIREAKEAWLDFTVPPEFEYQILPAILAGTNGVISGLSNVAPKLYVDSMHAARDDDLHADAVALHRFILSLMQVSAHALHEAGLMPAQREA